MPVDERTSDEKAYWVAFSRISGVGAARMQMLTHRFGSLRRAWQANDAEMLFAGLPPSIAEEVIRSRARIDPAEELARLARSGIEALPLTDPAYPDRLRNIPNPPAVLYFRGELLETDSISIAVVGTRKPSRYGLDVTKRIVTELAAAGVTIVSGLALGIDAAAHQAALDAGGRTLAVLGSGVDVLYPPSHRRLAESILQQGAILSEYPPGTKPDARNFPPRNRIISGLAQGVLVVEAGEQSGALITAQFALDQGRDTFAVPGGIYWPLSHGTNRLIQKGEAKLVTSAADILDELDVPLAIAQAQARTAMPADGSEAQVLSYLSRDPMHVDEIGRAAGLPAPTVASALSMLELKGLVRSVGGMNYVLAR